MAEVLDAPIGRFCGKLNVFCIVGPSRLRATTRRTATVPRGPLRDAAQRESAAAALGVETPASLEVAVNELPMPAHRAKDSTPIRAEKQSLLGGGRLHRP